jgi:hypothetical protein
MKLATKIVRGGVKLANKHEVKLRQSFERTVPKLLAAQRGRRTKGGAAAARKAARRLKTIAGRLCDNSMQACLRKLKTGADWKQPFGF